MKYRFDGVLRLWSASESWHFVDLPESISAEIKEVSAPYRRGFGSVRVDVRCQDSTWRTSVFRDAKAGCYILPVKAQVRKQQNLSAGDTAHFEIELVDF